jgi:hypothetical protein
MKVFHRYAQQTTIQCGGRECKCTEQAFGGALADEDPFVVAIFHVELGQHTHGPLKEGMARKARSRVCSGANAGVGTSAGAGVSVDVGRLPFPGREVSSKLSWGTP